MHCVVQLLLEEFGKWVKSGTAADEAQRDAFYTLVYDALQMVSWRPHPSPCVFEFVCLHSNFKIGKVEWGVVGQSWGMGEGWSGAGGGWGNEKHAGVGLTRSMLGWG